MYLAILLGTWAGIGTGYWCEVAHAERNVVLDQTVTRTNTVDDQLLRIASPADWAVPKVVVSTCATIAAKMRAPVNSITEPTHPGFNAIGSIRAESSQDAIAAGEKHEGQQDRRRNRQRFHPKVCRLEAIGQAVYPEGPQVNHMMQDVDGE